MSPAWLEWEFSSVQHNCRQQRISQRLRAWLFDGHWYCCGSIRVDTFHISSCSGGGKASDERGRLKKVKRWENNSAQRTYTLIHSAFFGDTQAFTQLTFNFLAILAAELVSFFFFPLTRRVSLIRSLTEELLYLRWKKLSWKCSPICAA